MFTKIAMSENGEHDDEKRDGISERKHLYSIRET